jgi:L-iditol 2-dehydrogenase
VQIGLAEKPVSLPFDLVCFRELTVTSGFASTPASWMRALELIETRRVELEPLLSEAVPLEEWEQAFAATRAGAGIKYVLVPR